MDRTCTPTPGTSLNTNPTPEGEVRAQAHAGTTHAQSHIDTQAHTHTHTHVSRILTLQPTNFLRNNVKSCKECYTTRGKSSGSEAPARRPASGADKSTLSVQTARWFLSLALPPPIDGGEGKAHPLSGGVASGDMLGFGSSPRNGVCVAGCCGGGGGETETESLPGGREGRDDGFSSMVADVTGIAAAGAVAAGAVADSMTAAAAEPSCSTTSSCDNCVVCGNHIVSNIQTYEFVSVEAGATSPTHTYTPASKQNQQQATAIIPSR